MVSLPGSSKNIKCFDLEALKNIGSEISPMVFENIKIFTAQEQRFDSLRSAIFGKLSQLSKRIISDTKEWQDMNLEAKCVLLAEIQECFYDLQLVEHASQMPVLALAKAIFSLNTKRCVHKTPSAKTKPSKKQKLQHILTREVCRADFEHKSPSVLKALSHEDSHVNSRYQHDDSNNLANQSIASVKKVYSTAKRRSNRGEKLQITNIVNQSENGASCDEKLDRNCESSGKHHKNNGGKTENSNAKLESLVAESALAEKVSNEVDELMASSNSVVDSAPPRRRAAALAAAVSVAETINPQRSVSPRKRNVAGTSLSYLNQDDGTQQTILNEPTYCLCEQISFGDMICCDYPKCSIEWFHFSCVNIKIKPKGKKWFCPLCRGEKPTVLKPSLQTKR